MTLYHINANYAHVRLIFVAAIDYKNTFTTKIYGITILYLHEVRASVESQQPLEIVQLPPPHKPSH